MRFSERQGIWPVKKVVQIDSIEEGLRNRLWNILTRQYWPVHYKYDSLTDAANSGLNHLLHALWHEYFKLPQDTIPLSREAAVARVRKYYFGCAWNEVYDFVEFVIRRDSWENRANEVIEECNQILEEELSGYRFLAGRITPVTAKEEVSAIEGAMAETATLFPLAAKHLHQAISLLSQKPRPDYRNSIKESISAVESVCVAITGDTKATLGQALKAIAPKLHGALQSGFEKLYGYTSDADGIRHGLLQEERLEQEDAVFMLVACSAFISYVIAKRCRTT